jgi:hypothetical protein
MFGWVGLDTDDRPPRAGRTRRRAGRRTPMPMVYELQGEPVVHGICSIPLTRARICATCEVVLDQGFPVCPQCGSRRIDELTSWLARVTRSAGPATTVLDSRSGWPP